MKRWALIKGSLVDTIVEQETQPVVFGEWVECTNLNVGPGNQWDGSSFIDVALVVPTFVTMRQAKLALFMEGLLDDVEAALNNLSEPQKTVANIEWTSAAIVERASPTVALIASVTGMTEEELDAIFIAASSL